MIFIRGFKYWELEEIIDHVGGRPAIIHELKEKHAAIMELFEEDPEVIFTINSSSGGVSSMLDPYRFLLIPKSLFEEKMVLDAIKEGFERRIHFIKDEARLSRISRIMDQYQRHYEELIDNHNSTKQGMNEPCYAFTYLDGKIVTVFTTTPTLLTSFLSRPVVYEITGYERGELPKWVYSKNTEPPDIYYKMNGPNEIEYSFEKRKGFSAVGE